MTAVVRSKAGIAECKMYMISGRHSGLRKSTAERVMYQTRTEGLNAGSGCLYYSSKVHVIIVIIVNRRYDMVNIHDFISYFVNTYYFFIIFV